MDPADTTGATLERPLLPPPRSQPAPSSPPGAATLPSGTVAFLFTDIEGSTRLWQEQPRAMAAAVARHDALLHTAIAEQGGYVFKTVGDAFCAAFPSAPPAVATALAAQRALAAEPWREIGEIRVRMGIHVGEAEERDNDYFGPAVNRVARLMSAGHGGQVLLSLPAAELARESLPATVRLRDLGEHRLKDLSRPEHIFQLLAADLPADFPPLATLEYRPNNLPPQLTPLVGREKEMAAVCEILVRDGVRLVTLTGPGGTGKTRLSLQAGTELIEAYADGVWFVPLEKATDETIIVSAIAQALGVREVAGQRLLDSLTEYLRGKRLLLLLDNFEQVVHAAPLVARLLSDAPRLELLVTSRIRLGIQGEREYAVPPLEVPDHVASPGELMGCSAIRLFVERAQAAKSDFVLTEENAAAVVEICRQLDGLPLAIELAAARIKLLPPRAMQSRLQHRLALLTGGGRDRPERQQTLRGAIAWSYDLLATEERTLFARLSACAGGCTYEAAEIIGNAEGDLDLLTLLEALVDHSLVRQVEDPDGEPRFTMLATIREYALDRLAESGENDAMHERHADWCLAVAEEGEPALLEQDQQEWLERLNREHDNFRAALTWLAEHGDPEKMMRLAGALAPFWEMRGYTTEGRQRLEAALAAAADVSAGSRVKVLRGLATLMVAQRDYAPATSLYEQSLALAREIGDKHGTAESLVGLASAVLHQRDNKRAAGLYEEALSQFQALGNAWGTATAKNGLASAVLDQGEGDIPRADALYKESLAIFQSLGNQREEAKTLNNLATIAHDRGDYPQAMERYQRSLELTRALNDRRTSALILYNQGIIEEHRGNYVEAENYYEESAAIFRDLGARDEKALLFLGLGLLADLRGEHARAVEMHDQSLALARALGDKRGEANALDGKAIALLHQGCAEQAEPLFREAVTLRQEIGERRSIVESLGGLAAVAYHRGQSERAVRLYGAEVAIRDTIDSPRTPASTREHDGILADARAALGEEAFAAAWAAGQALTLDEAIAEALRADPEGAESDTDSRIPQPC